MSEASSSAYEGDSPLDLAAREAGDTLMDNGADGELAELRRLLLAPEQNDLAELRVRLRKVEGREFLVEDISRVLPQAVILRASQDNHLTRVLEPSIEATLRNAVQRDPRSIADALFPIFGPAIRKSIAEALRGVMETINRTVEHSLSVQSLKWRAEAWRTGKPFSEILLTHTLQFRVEQVFLIDEETGLPLQHVVADAVIAQDSALVSSMLTAIQDFAQDSFGTAEGETLATMQVGELLVWIEQGPEAILAAVIRGVPAPELRVVLQDVIETIHLQYNPELEAFDGDPEPLAVTRPLLEEALLAQYREKKGKRRALSPAWMMIIVVALLLGFWAFTSTRSYQRWETYIALLDGEPGIVVTEQGRDDGRWYVKGLRDPLARDPAALLALTPLASEDVRGTWQPYQALDSALVVRRAAQQLAAPATVQFSYSDGVLRATGAAPGTWQATAREQAPFIAGVTTYDDAALGSSAAQQVAALTQQIEQKTLQFSGGNTQLLPGQEAVLDSLATLIEQLREIVEGAGISARLQILGHASSEGTERFNENISRQRAEQVREALAQRGVAVDQVEAVGTGTPRTVAPEETEEDRALNRSVTFRVVTSGE